MLAYLASEADKTLEEIIPFLPKPATQMTVAFIPTAGDLYFEKPWQERDRKKLRELGFQVEDVDIETVKGDALTKTLAEADVIFVAGGNTSYLLEKAQESDFLNITKKLVREGKIYIGSSAGSLLAGPSIEVDKIYDDGKFGKELTSYKSLGLVDFVPLPHADNPKYAPYLERIFQEYGNKYNLKRLNDNQAILVIDERTQVLNV